MAGTIFPLGHNGAELDSTLRRTLLGFVKQIPSFVVPCTAVVYQDLLREIRFKLEHGAGGRYSEGGRVLESFV